MAGELVPPLGQLEKLSRQPREHLRFLARGRLVPKPGLGPENLLHQLDQFVHALIGDAVFNRRKQAELTAEPENVPRIDNRPAFDPAVQQIVDLGEAGESLDEPAAFGRAVRGRDQAMDLAHDPGGHGRHDLHLAAAPPRGNRAGRRVEPDARAAFAARGAATTGRSNAAGPRQTAGARRPPRPPAVRHAPRSGDRTPADKRHRDKRQFAATAWPTTSKNRGPADFPRWCRPPSG